MTHPGQGPQQGPQQPPQGYPPHPPFPGQTSIDQQPRQKRVNRGLIITFVVVLVLALGTGGTWLALHLRSDDGGGDTPEEAVENLATALDEDDTAGVLETLAPGEGGVFQDLSQEGLAEFERLGMLKDEAEPDILAGIDIHAEGLAFDEPQQVNEQLRIAKLTEGTITIDIDPEAGPLREEYREAISLALLGFTEGLVSELPASPGVPGFPGGMPEAPNFPGVPEAPEVEVPEVEVPDIEVPEIEVPEVEVPDIEVPEVETPQENDAPDGFRARPEESETDADQNKSNEMTGAAPHQPGNRQDSSDEAATSETIDIADLVEETGEPLRVATVEEEGSWYPSLLHSLVDEVLQDQGIPWPSERIPGNGTESPEEALKQLMQAVLDQDFTRVIELLPPDEMGVLHDVGALVTAIESTGSSDIEITQVDTETNDEGNATRVTPNFIEITDTDGEKATITRNGDCYEVAIPAGAEQACAADLPKLLKENLEADPDMDIPENIQEIITDVGGGVLEDGLSLVTTEVDGEHYVSPLRSFGEWGMTPLRNLEQDELETLLDTAGPR